MNLSYSSRCHSMAISPSGITPAVLRTPYTAPSECIATKSFCKPKPTRCANDFIGKAIGEKRSKGVKGLLPVTDIV